MGVVAKFQVTEVVLRPYNAEVKLSPVSATDDGTVTQPGEDKAFWEATPSGALSMTIKNEVAAEQFQPGDKFYVTFDKAPA